MSTIQWAKKCEIKIKPLPRKFSTLRRAMAVAQGGFYGERFNGGNLLAYVRHVKTNYERLLNELARRGDDDGQGYEIIKARCNRAISAALLEKYQDDGPFQRQYINEVTL